MKQKQDEYIVDTWWDRRSRNYITQLLDENGYQIGDAIYTGNKDDAMSAHNTMINEAKKIKKENEDESNS